MFFCLVVAVAEVLRAQVYNKEENAAKKDSSFPGEISRNEFFGTTKKASGNKAGEISFRCSGRV